MRPHPASIMSGTTAWRQWNVPVRLTAIMRSHASGVMSRNDSKPSMPALVTRIPTVPKRAPDRVQRSENGGAVADVDPRCHGGGAIGLELLGHAVGGILVDVQHRDPVPPPGQVPADGRAHARAAASDDCDPAHVPTPTRTSSSRVSCLALGSPASLSGWRVSRARRRETRRQGGQMLMMVHQAVKCPSSWR